MVVRLPRGWLKKTNKFGAKPRRVGGIRFASKLEAKWWGRLQVRERAREITQLTPHPAFPIVVNGVTVCTYIADYAWVETANGLVVVADAKGMQTPVYRLKKKLLMATHGIDVLELTKRTRNRTRLG